MSIPVIIGGGLAGLSVALALAPKPVVILGCKISSGMTSSELAQGGIAAAVGFDDNLHLHEKDTLAAGAGLCNPRVVKTIIEAGPKAIERLSIWGVAFDRNKNGDLRTGLEGAHSRRRVVHANGDSTGASVMSALITRARATKSILFLEEANALEIRTNSNGISGVVYLNNQTKTRHLIETNKVILATGSACALWRHTTVPHGSWGQGLLLAAKAGARLCDLEFVQFHPTALDVGIDPMPLISEALRGEGARLVNDEGKQFVGELSPRDIVARAIWAEIERGQKVYLDARIVNTIRSRFPTIFESCLKSGVDPRESLIPIHPVAHYHMGGVATDIDGRTNVIGLMACGEVACTGLHGANRLASNSLLEAVVMGCRIADAIRLDISNKATPVIKDLENAEVQEERADDIARVRTLMNAQVGLRRTQTGLETAIESLSGIAQRNLHAQIALMITKAALARKESRGSHDRKDYPETDPAFERSINVAYQNDAVVIEGGAI